MMPKETAVYLRVSTSSQSIEAQRAEIGAYLTRKGIDPLDCEYFSDEGVSGATMDRPALKRLNQQAEMGRIQTIVMYDLDRLARNMVGGLQQIEDWVDRLQIKVCVVTLPIDLDSAFAPMILANMMAIAQYFLRQQKQKQRAGNKRLIDDPMDAAVLYEWINKRSATKRIRIIHKQTGENRRVKVEQIHWPRIVLDSGETISAEDWNIHATWGGNCQRKRDLSRAIKLYQEGMPIEDIAKIEGCSREWMYRLLLRARKGAKIVHND